jgi:transposase
MTDEEWAIIAPLLPGHNRLGRRCNFELGKVAFHKVELGDVWDAIQYSVASGCACSGYRTWFGRISQIIGKQSHPVIQLESSKRHEALIDTAVTYFSQGENYGAYHSFWNREKLRNDARAERARY